MASKYQSRLVGMIVLVSVAVIVLPDLFDGKKEHYKDEIVAIPIKPDLETKISTPIQDPIEDQVELPQSPVKQTVQKGSEPNVVEQRSHSKSSSVASSNSNKVTIDLDKAKEKVSDTVAVTVQSVSTKNQYKDSAWIIQLMALRNKDNAQKLVADLQKRHYQAHVKQEEDFSRVIIGPDVSRETLEKQLVELEKITGAKGQILKFNPLNP